MGILQDGMDALKLAGKIANPELIEKVTALNEKLLELSDQNVTFKSTIAELQEKLKEVEQKPGAPRLAFFETWDSTTAPTN